MKVRKWFALMALPVGLAACTAQQVRDTLPISMAGISGLACAAFYKGRNPTLVTALCAAAGGLIGVGLRQYLNEQERLQLADATTRSLDTGRPQTVKTDQGNTILTELVRPVSSTGSQARPAARPSTPQQSPATPPPADGCQQVKQTVITAGGERHEDTVTACKKNGVWEV